jgi:hypothetical protein
MSFTFGHARQFDRPFEMILRRAWAVGAGPGDEAITIDPDSTTCGVHGHRKRGAAYGYTRILGYHPLLATRAATDEVLHIRQRKSSTNSKRGAKRVPMELVARVRRARASGAPADSLTIPKAVGEPQGDHQARTWDRSRVIDHDPETARKVRYRLHDMSALQLGEKRASIPRILRGQRTLVAYPNPNQHPQPRIQAYVRGDR